MRHDTQISADWELDRVRLELYHYVMARPEKYHRTLVAELRRQYADLLYYAAASAARKRRAGEAAVTLARAIAIGVARGRLPALFRTISKSSMFGAVRLGRPVASQGRDPYDAVVQGVEIPWRMHMRDV